ncbi:MAG: hypothetical protein B6D72_05800 [gamma proteobacterium symbiont of Ctena orbiculata]|nr:hypothetical protein [Candidatus Thiodiazotropha taylori]PUB86624.1 MAG: hypothetical protein DBP00_10950 [gamma proteobacterium symbiont of Ctena orbiculata]PVV13343.1 MAG: hypothetical protein B6D72_05800 [gamma proteobacterium symbiont of Ctena orbiculata]PVV13532.1 MAG: hypothetical protein B6D82_07930 [gamma proteobacterium symbiont of Ctena orbiculata]PVV25299.1 MAG: hypothetical protein B6D74_03445 [gamma proteobacterium symbiont of Ctena orbiculata]
MLPILLGLVLAMLFGLMSFFVYGLEGLISYPWIDAVFWALIAVGALITLINEIGQCLACRFKHLVSNDLFNRYCNQLACAQ